MPIIRIWSGHHRYGRGPRRPERFPWYRGESGRTRRSRRWQPIGCRRPSGIGRVTAGSWRGARMRGAASCRSRGWCRYTTSDGSEGEEPRDGVHVRGAERRPRQLVTASQFSLVGQGGVRLIRAASVLLRSRSRCRAARRASPKPRHLGFGRRSGSVRAVVLGRTSGRRGVDRRSRRCRGPLPWSKGCAAGGVAGDGISIIPGRGSKPCRWSGHSSGAVGLLRPQPGPPRPAHRATGGQLPRPRPGPWDRPGHALARP